MANEWLDAKYDDRFIGGEFDSAALIDNEIELGYLIDEKPPCPFTIDWSECTCED